MLAHNQSILNMRLQAEKQSQVDQQSISNTEQEPEVTVIFVDNTFWMNEDRACDFSKPQAEAIVLYSEEKLKAHPRNKVGLVAMGFVQDNLRPTSDLHQIRSKLERLTYFGQQCMPVGQALTIFLDTNLPKRRLVVFSGGRLNVGSVKLEIYATRLKESRVAVDVVNFGLQTLPTTKGELLEAFAKAANNDGNSHYLYVPSESATSLGQEILCSELAPGGLPMQEEKIKEQEVKEKEKIEKKIEEDDVKKKEKIEKKIEEEEEKKMEEEDVKKKEKMEQKIEEEEKKKNNMHKKLKKKMKIAARAEEVKKREEEVKKREEDVTKREEEVKKKEKIYRNIEEEELKKKLKLAARAIEKKFEEKIKKNLDKHGAIQEKKKEEKDAIKKGKMEQLPIQEEKKKEKEVSQISSSFQSEKRRMAAVPSAPRPAPETVSYVENKRKDDIRMSNIESTRSVAADVMCMPLGPRSMLKMLLNASSDVIITNDALLF